MEHMNLLRVMDPQRTIFVSAHCLNVFYRMVEMQSRAMATVIGMAVANQVALSAMQSGMVD